MGERRMMVGIVVNGMVGFGESCSSGMGCCGGG